MRYSPDHREQTRARIVAAASRAFRARGTPGAAIGGLMRELKLTHGGFYRHFHSKEQLFEEALQASIEEMSGQIASAADRAGRGGAVAAIVTTYLSAAHCDNPGAGCPLAALAVEIGRLPRASRDRCQRMLSGYALRMAPYLPGDSPRAREDTAVALFSAMAGTLAYARTIADADRRRAVLRAAREYHLSALS